MQGFCSGGIVGSTDIAELTAQGTLSAVWSVIGAFDDAASITRRHGLALARSRLLAGASLTPVIYTAEFLGE
jgi:hypothetical protein